MLALWRKIGNSRHAPGTGTSGYRFHALKSVSAVELQPFSKRSHIPRYLSQQGDDLRQRDGAADALQLILVDESDDAHSGVLFGFLKDGCPFGVSTSDRAIRREEFLTQATSCCERFQQIPGFVGGLLLRSIDEDSLYPFIHYVFLSEIGSVTISRNDQGARITPKSPGHWAESIGIYDEYQALILKDQPPSPLLPRNRSTGYIVLGFKVLENTTNNNRVFEDGWPFWTGALDFVHGLCPRSWSLRRVSFHRCHQLTSNDCFAYVLVCEFSDLLLKSNLAKACEVVERLRARQSGYAGLYSVHWSYTPMPGSTVPHITGADDPASDLSSPNTENSCADSEMWNKLFSF